eukprot:CAMPEP_0184874028 /NCGR_PEP_ID=MMETSP0580-20130426/42166_1 /TAXON_ID=1118495 /ORGANISM="Dactyliosolen fragilissimus" /LENGTH=396 /DNA_ID=CAMNT_0027376993 /DNA_START=227 /DNA_END=1415 /DNA_ORIENTATION=+
MNLNEKFSTSSRIKKTLDPCVVLMKQIIAKHQHLWNEKGGIYSLAQGIVYWSPPKEAYDALHTEAQIHPSSSTLHQYAPDEGIPELLAALRTKLSLENGLSNDPNNTHILVTSGELLLSLVSEGERCVVFAPYYFNHVMAIQMTRGDEALCIGPMREDDGIPDLDWLRDQLEKDQKIQQSKGKKEGKIQMVTVVNPGNPTGVSIPRERLDTLIALCKKFGVWLVMDNTYEHFDHTKDNRNSKNKNVEDNSVPFQCSTQGHVLNIFSFSKGFAMAGFRVGYVVINGCSDKSRNAYEQMVKVQDTIPICASRISQIIALGALSAGRDWVQQKVSTLDPGREAILNAIQPLQKIIGGSGAMYFMGKLPDGVSDEKSADYLVKQYGVAVIPGSYCGYPGW